MRVNLAMYVMWVVATGLQLASAILIYRRKLRSEYKYLFAYLLLNVAQNVGLFFILRLHNFRLYYFSYWATTVLTDICCFMVLQELFAAAFRPFAGLRDMARVVFGWALLAMLLVAFVVFSSGSMVGGQNLAFAIVNLQRSIRVMQCGLLLFMLMGSQYLGLSFKNRVFGLSVGFGLTATVELMTWSIVSALNVRHAELVNYVINGSELLALGMFFVYFLKKEKEGGLVNVPLDSPLLRWNEAVLAVGTGSLARRSPAVAEPFMPSVERMVEQVMDRVPVTVKSN